MISSIRRRIEKLEAADKRLTRRIIWEDGTGSAEREIARLEAVGELDGVVLHIVHWRTNEAIAAANELMRKLKAAREQRTKRLCESEAALWVIDFLKLHTKAAPDPDEVEIEERKAMAMGGVPEPYLGAGLGCALGSSLGVRLRHDRRCGQDDEDHD
jgi:hypothetical protein